MSSVNPPPMKLALAIMEIVAGHSAGLLLSSDMEHNYWYDCIGVKTLHVELYKRDWGSERIMVPIARPAHRRK